MYIRLFPTWPHTGCASSHSQYRAHAKQQSFTYPNLAAAYHVSKPCNSLSRIQTLQQSFTHTYPNLAAVYRVSKPCSSLSRIQTLQQSAFTYPNLARSSLEDVPKFTKSLTSSCDTRNAHYDSVVLDLALDGDLCSEFPTLQTSAVETDTIVVQNYFVVAINDLYYAPVLLTSTHRLS